MTTTDPRRAAYLTLRGEPCRCPSCSACQSDGPTIAQAAVAPAAPRWHNRVQIALACLTTLGAVVVGLCAVLTPSLALAGLSVGAAASTVIHWQLCD